MGGVRGGAMSRRKAMVALMVVALGWGGIGTGAEPDPAARTAAPDVVRIVVTLRAMSERLRLALHLSTMGVVAPTLVDQRLYAGQVVNLLVGPGSDRFDPRLGPESAAPGLLPEARALLEFLPRAEIPEPIRDRAAFLVKKLNALLTMTLDELLHCLRSRRLDHGADRMLRAFAFLNAALGRETDPAHLGGTLALLRLLPPVAP